MRGRDQHGAAESGSARLIPSIESLRQRPPTRALEERYGRQAVVEGLRQVSGALRERLRGNRAHDEDPTTADEAADWIEARLPDHLAATFVTALRRVLNATGVVIHTNLGRAPLAEAALTRIREAAAYVALEYDLEQGARGARDVHAERLLRQLTGAEAGVVVNNNAAATLLVLSALALGREVIISRGELVEIGGGFRVPDVLRASGAILREVGTTNRTRAADYAAVITDRTAMLLRVHPSNFRIEGFAERPPLSDLVALGRRFDVPVVEDLGSGHLTAGDVRLAEEPLVQDSITAGADLVCFSGDKLLGGPQAGIIVGRRTLVTTVRRHPLMRALRVDKLTYAALEATLVEHASGRAGETVPVQRMIRLSAEEIGRRAEAVAANLAALGGLEVTIQEGASTIGGGSAPGELLPTRLLVLRAGGLGPDELAARLRAQSPPLVARIAGDRVAIDLRTVAPDDDHLVAEVIVAAVTGRG